MRRPSILLTVIAALALCSCETRPPRRRAAKPKPSPEATAAPKEAAPAAPKEAAPTAPKETAPAAPKEAAAPEPEEPAPAAADVAPVDPDAPEWLPAGWLFGCQAYTFRSFTFLEAVEKSAGLGLAFIEMYPGQKIGGDLQGATGHGMNAATRRAVREKLAEHGVRVVAYGVVGASGEKGWREVFDFAKEMGIGTVVCEASGGELATVSKLCDEYGLNAAIHNHPKPSRYWDPETVLAACKGLSKRVGACADTGHWMRSGLDPLEGLKKLEGRIVALHLKDVRDGADVPYGTGSAPMPKMLAELRRQGFRGPVSLEYESQPRNPYTPVKQCVRYVRLNAKLPPEDLEAGKVLAGHESANVADAWRNLDPTDDGLWDMKAVPMGTTDIDADTSAYYDTTDDGKGTVTGCGPGFPKESPAEAFDNRGDTKFCILMDKIWLQYEYPKGKKWEVTAYSLRSANDAPDRDPVDWRLLGSSDGQDWTVLDEQKGQGFEARFHKRLFKVAKPGSFGFYRLDVTKVNSDRSQIAEIELLVDKALGPPPPKPSAAPKEHPDTRRWPALIADDLSDAIAPRGVWSVEDGVMTASADQCIWTKKVYDNFILDLEFRTADGTNSGVIVYCADTGNWIPNSVEIQIADDYADQWAKADKTWQCAAIFGHLAAKKSMVKKPGEWNRMTVTCQDSMIHVMLNGEMVTEMDMTKWKSAKKNPDGSDIPGWLSRPKAELATRGHIGFQGKHAGAPIWFRNIKVKELD